MPNAVIVDAIRSPVGRRGGKLKDIHPVDLAAHVLNALKNRNGLEAETVEDVIMAVCPSWGSRE